MIDKIKLDVIGGLFNYSTGNKLKRVVALELKKIYDPKHVIDKILVLGDINYKDNKDLDKKMFDLTVKLSKKLDLNLNRVLNYPDDDFINIEIEGRETKFIGEYSFKFYCFYEMNQQKVFLLAFEGELEKDGTYMVYKNIMFEDKFPYEFIPDPKYYN